MEVSEALRPLPGVVEVKTDPRKKTAVCKVDPAKFDSQAALEKLAAVKFPGTIAESAN